MYCKSLFKVYSWIKFIWMNEWTSAISKRAICVVCGPIIVVHSDTEPCHEIVDPQLQCIVRKRLYTYIWIFA